MRELVGIGLAIASLVLMVRAVQTGNYVLPQVGQVDRWLRGFRLMAQALGCAAVAGGVLSGQVWPVAVGLAFAFEETIETSVCLSVLQG